MAKSKSAKTPDTTIVVNKKARHDYFIEDIFEAGIALLGWEVKSLRHKKVQLVDSYVVIKEGEAMAKSGEKTANIALDQLKKKPDGVRYADLVRLSP